ncbi:prepilin peptidase [Aestuariibius sp. HNIBRBA575]|uniref:prepilin peptidase n=1 Tax=Aestuariibius sp. HNIBRBA575 TaxID=3233343 RepID=UPI0034A23D68
MPPLAALWFLPFILPLCLHTAYSDMKYMKIRDWNVQSMAMVFILIGPFVMSWETYLWQLGHLPIVLIIGMFLNAGGIMGAGDAKFIAAASPFIAKSDLQFVFLLLAGAFIAGLVVHRTARATAIKNLVPTWESWVAGKRFPMGLPLAGALSIYLIQLARGALL